MRTKIVTLLVSLIFLYSCNDEQTKPDYLMTEEEFIPVLTDFEIAESIVRLRLHQKGDSIHLQDSVFQAVFRKHEITKAVFDSNFTHYTKQPEVFEKLYEKVLEQLSEKSAEFKKKPSDD